MASKNGQSGSDVAQERLVQLQEGIVRDNLNLQLLRLWHRTQKTVLFVTHSIPEAVFLSTKIVVNGYADHTPIGPELTGQGVTSSFYRRSGLTM